MLNFRSGWFLLLTSGLGFYRVKRYERTVQQSSNNANRSNTGAGPFTIGIFGSPPGLRYPRGRSPSPSPFPPPEPQTQAVRQEENLVRDLQNVGLA